MRILVPFLVLVLAVSCMTNATKTAIAAKEKQVNELTSQVNALEASGTSTAEAIAALKAQLTESSAELKDLKNTGVKERISSGAGIASQVADYAGPIAGLFLPFVGTVIAGLGAGLKTVAEKFGTSTTVAAK